MDKTYIKNKGILVGTFNEDDLRNKIDKKAIDEAMKETGYEYIHSEYVKRKGEIVGLKVYVCKMEDGDFI